MELRGNTPFREGFHGGDGAIGGRPGPGQALSRSTQRCGESAAQPGGGGSDHP